MDAQVKKRDEFEQVAWDCPLCVGVIGTADGDRFSLIDIGPEFALPAPDGELQFLGLLGITAKMEARSALAVELSFDALKAITHAATTHMMQRLRAAQARPWLHSGPLAEIVN